MLKSDLTEGDALFDFGQKERPYYLPLFLDVKLLTEGIVYFLLENFGIPFNLTYSFLNTCA